jgi:hypothetical protein
MLSIWPTNKICITPQFRLEGVKYCINVIHLPDSYCCYEDEHERHESCETGQEYGLHVGESCATNITSVTFMNSILLAMNQPGIHSVCGRILCHEHNLSYFYLLIWILHNLLWINHEYSLHIGKSCATNITSVTFICLFEFYTTCFEPTRNTVCMSQNPVPWT